MPATASQQVKVTGTEYLTLATVASGLPRAVELRILERKLWSDSKLTRVLIKFVHENCLSQSYHNVSPLFTLEVAVRTRFHDVGTFIHRASTSVGLGYSGLSSRIHPTCGFFSPFKSCVVRSW